MGLANPSNNLLVIPTIVICKGIKVCETFCDLDCLTICMNGLVSYSIHPNAWTLLLAQETGSRGFASSCRTSRAITRTSSDFSRSTASSVKTTSVTLMLLRGGCTPLSVRYIWEVRRVRKTSKYTSHVLTLRFQLSHQHQRVVQLAL